MIKKLCLISIVGFTLQAQNSVHLDVVMDKNRFLEGEPIFLGILLSNPGPADIEIPRPSVSAGSLALLIQDDKGAKLKYRGKVITGLGDSKTTLKANGEIYMMEEITMSFGRLFSASALGRFLEPGAYKLHVRFHYAGSEVASETQDFLVVPPEGVEKDIYELFRSTLTNVSYGRADVGQAASTLLSFHSSYPNSPYTPLALSILPGWYEYRLGNASKASLVEKIIAHEYSASGKAQPFIKKILTETASRQDRIDLLTALIARTQGSVINKVMVKLLEKE
ncbi:MAG: hypothetical protein HBSIN02_25440 [Bacteroidia bacterium]|nr:MAG: hypothetical protein HBSIN02_25440 [Bacteroidia bacterium]